MENQRPEVLGERVLGRRRVGLQVRNGSYAERVPERPAKQANATRLPVCRGSRNVVLVDEQFNESSDFLAPRLEECRLISYGAILECVQVCGSVWR